MNLSQIKVEYVISFSDALFAFSITFMALSLQLPNFPSNIVESELTRRLSQTLIPSIIHYIISFMVVGSYWISYHRIFEHIRHADITLVWLNLLFLLFISLTAYFTGLLTSYATHEIVVITFAGIMAATGFMLCIIWWYATHNSLVDKDISPPLVRYFLLRSLASPVIFLMSIGISFINIQLAQLFWALILPVGIIIYMKHIPHLSRL
jgi:TMEM175 potassium channel family protein